MSIREHEEGPEISQKASDERDQPVEDAMSTPESATAPSTSSHFGATWIERLRPVLGLDRLWFALVALALGIHAQFILTPGLRPDPNADTTSATRWYIISAAVLVVGWAGNYTNLSLIRLPSEAVRGLRGWAGVLWAPLDRRRIAIVSGAVGLDLLAILILRGNWYSLVGGLLWVFSLGVLVAGYAGERGAESKTMGASDMHARFWTRARTLETVAIIAIFGLALAFRLWRLGDLLPGMHGDEGEAGTQGLDILNGNLVSPFTRGWFNQSNIYYWSLAICMKVFGTGLFGLRTFALICGMLTVVFVYLIAREMFGVRVAIIAGFFISFQSAALLFSRQEFSNVTIPPLQAAMLYFLVRGLRTRRYLDFVLAGLIGGLAMYYFAGGRLIAPVAAVFLGYLAIVHRPFLRAYWTRVLAFFLGVIVIASPFAAYYLAYPIPSNAYPNDRFIWSHHADLSALYGASDWRTIVWDQLTRTFSILTNGIDLSAMSALDFPIARPLEAVLLILGLVWALWRWQDSRYFLLSLWFWSSLVVGGVLTTEAPNLPRIVGILPAFAILVAVMLDAVWEQFTVAGIKLGGQRPWGRAGVWSGGILAAVVILISGIQNKQLYIDSWLNEHTNVIVTGQAMYVQQHGLRYHYYDMGAPAIYWTHGDNRFINPQALLQGEDAVNLPNNLPVIDNGPNAEQNAIFLVWPNEYDYLSVLQAYYPEGTSHPVRLGDPSHLTQPLIGFIISHQAIDKHRTLLARYRSANGSSIQRREARIGLPNGSSAPSGLRFPVNASWEGALVAPSYGPYTFALHAPPGSRLTIDGVTVFSRRSTSAPLVMAQGLHSISLSAPLASQRTRVDLSWSGAAIPRGPIDHRYLWDNHIGRAWSGTIRPALAGLPLHASMPSRRVDGFLGFRSTGLAFGLVGGLSNQWTSILTVKQAGSFGFELNALGSSSLLVDGKVVVHDVALGPNANVADGRITLAPGRHRVEIRYTWQIGTGYLEVAWTPPGEVRQFFITPTLSPPGPAVWHASSLPGLPLTTPPAREPPVATTGTSGSRSTSGAP